MLLERLVERFTGLWSAIAPLVGRFAPFGAVGNFSIAFLERLPEISRSQFVGFTDIAFNASRTLRKLIEAYLMF
jgi:hypothetical protein